MVTLAGCSDGNPYGVKEGLVFGMPVVCEKGSWRYVEDLPINEIVKKRIDISTSKKRLRELLMGRGFAGGSRYCTFSNGADCQSITCLF